MYFKTEDNLENIEKLLPKFISIIGYKTLHTRLNTLSRKLSGIQGLSIARHHKFESNLLHIINYKKKTGRYPKLENNTNILNTYSYIFMVCKVFDRLSKQGQNRLKGYQIDALNSDYGFKPYIFEMTVATHLLQNGYNVDFSDLESRTQHDFTARLDDREIEVECKYLSADLGRNITQTCIQHLSMRLEKFLETDTGEYSKLIEITLPHRLTKNLTSDKNFIEDIKSAHKTKVIRIKKDRYEIIAHNLSDFDFLQYKKLNQDFYRELIEKICKNYNFHAFVVRNVNDHVSVIVVKSESDDQVLNKIYKRVTDEAKKQFTQKKPAIMCCYLDNLSESELISLCEEQKEKVVGLQKTANEVMFKRPYIHTLSFFCDSSRLSKKEQTDGNVYSLFSKVFSFRNPKFENPSSSGFSIF